MLPKFDFSRAAAAAAAGRNPPWTVIVGFNPGCDIICDGVADDVEINAALAIVILLGGGTVVLEAGVYDIRARLLINAASNVWLLGQGATTVLLHNAGVAGFDMIELNASAGCQISDLYVDGNARATCLIYFTATTGSVAKDCFLTDSNDEAVHLANNSNYNDVHSNFITNCTDQGVRIESGILNRIYDNYIEDASVGIESGLNGDIAAITDNIIVSSTGFAGIFLQGDSNNAVGNLVYNSTSVGVVVTGGHCTLSGNMVTVAGSDGIQLSASYSSAFGNTIYDVAGQGIFFAAAYCNATGNTIRKTDWNGIYCTSSDCIIASNKVDSPDDNSTNTFNGIYCYNAHRCLILGNHITNSLTKNVQYGIYLRGTIPQYSWYMSVVDNHIRTYDVGIYLNGTQNAKAKDNYLAGNTVYFVDNGTNTMLASIVVPFVDGNDPLDIGFLINAAAEYARAFTMLPVDVQQVVRMKIYGVSGVAEADRMLADFTIYGAADNQPYTTHNGSVASQTSTTLNFAANDIVYWTITSAGVLAFIGKDSIMVKAIYRAAAAPDCETNCYFRTVEIEYV